jgi:simple sugar transport system ATP-binding protein
MSGAKTFGPEALRATDITKSFGAISALNGISLHVRRGEVLGILGDNGAGKSTLMKIITGFHQPTSGQISIDGQPVSLGSVDQARALGIECVYQDLALINTLPIYHNMFLNRELRTRLGMLDHAAMRKRAAAALEDIGVNVPSVNEEVAMLSGGQRQAIAIARAVYTDAKILLLDEPLAAMGAREAGLIIDLIRRQQAKGTISIIMIMHNYAQTLEIADRVMMMQRGAVTFEGEAKNTSVVELLEIIRREYRHVPSQ